MPVDPRYFDYAASAPPYREAIESFLETSRKYYANPSSVHRQGKAVKKKLNDLKKEFCDMLGFYDGRLILCSSATEANNTVIEGFIKKNPDKRILISQDVHESIWYAMEKYSSKTDMLSLNPSGGLDTGRLMNQIIGQTGLVCINHVCNELGTVHDVEKISALCASNEVRLLIDGTQAVGHIPVDLDLISCHFYTFSAHKFGGVRSAGGILMRDEPFEPFISGGKQEWSLRAGTENIAGLASAVQALKKNLGGMKEEKKRLNDLKSWLLKELKEKVPTILINTPENGLPGFLSASIPGHKGNEIVTALSLSGFSISTGSACHADRIEPSRIVLSLGRNVDEATGTLRISMGYGTTKEAVQDLFKELIAIINP